MSKFKLAGHHRLGLTILLAGVIIGGLSTLVPGLAASYLAVIGIALILSGIWIMGPA